MAKRGMILMRMMMMDAYTAGPTAIYIDDYDDDEEEDDDEEDGDDDDDGDDAGDDGVDE